MFGHPDRGESLVRPSPRPARGPLPFFVVTSIQAGVAFLLLLNPSALEPQGVGLWPSSEISSRASTRSKVVVSGPSDFDERSCPAACSPPAASTSVISGSNLRYQDAVRKTESRSLGKLTKRSIQVLSMQHPSDEWTYTYL
jgi:hypothetical protein